MVVLENPRILSVVYETAGTQLAALATSKTKKSKNQICATTKHYTSTIMTGINKMNRELA